MPRGRCSTVISLCSPGCAVTTTNCVSSSPELGSQPQKLSSIETTAADAGEALSARTRSASPSDRMP